MFVMMMKKNQNHEDDGYGDDDDDNNDNGNMIKDEFLIARKTLLTLYVAHHIVFNVH